MSLAYNLTKLVLVGALIALGIVAIGLDWVTETQGWAFVMALVGYVIGNVSVTSISPIISRD